jgi:hypothetical protein
MPLLVLFGAVGLVLLIVCVNVANLLLVRVTARSRELAVRGGPGSGAVAVIRQLLVESLVLAAAGGAVGLLVAFWSMDVLRVLLPDSLPRAADVRVDGGVIAFALVLSAAAGVLFGTLPAWRATALQIFDVLKAGGRAARRPTGTVRSDCCGTLVNCGLFGGVYLLVTAGRRGTPCSRALDRSRGSVEPGFRTSACAGGEFVLFGEPGERAESWFRSYRRPERAGTLPFPVWEAAGTSRTAPLRPIQRDRTLLSLSAGETWQRRKQDT